MKVRVQIFFGTRPEAIKLAPLIRCCLDDSRRFDTIVCHTQQHTDLAQPVIDYFKLPIDEELGVMSPGQSLAALHARCLQAADRVIEQHQPDCVVVQGDTTTAMAAASAAFYRRTPIVHVEAGLRTGQILSPWPEEFNRLVISHIADLNCAPTDRAADQLRAENIAEDSILMSGNTVVDALQWTLRQEQLQEDQWEREFPMLQDKRLVLITGHRRENFGDNMKNMCLAIRRLARQHRDVAFLYPVHLNPNVQQAAAEYLADEQNLYLLPPATYPAFVWLMNRSTLILTDSGGIQEESVSLRKPTLVLRDTTERPEAVQSGMAQLVGTDADVIFQRANGILDGSDVPRLVNESPFGTGVAAEKIATRIYEDWGHE